MWIPLDDDESHSPEPDCDDADNIDISAIEKRKEDKVVGKQTGDLTVADIRGAVGGEAIPGITSSSSYSAESNNNKPKEPKGAVVGEHQPENKLVEGDNATVKEGSIDGEVTFEGQKQAEPQLTKAPSSNADSEHVKCEAAESTTETPVNVPDLPSTQSEEVSQLKDKMDEDEPEPAARVEDKSGTLSEPESSRDAPTEPEAIMTDSGASFTQTQSESAEPDTTNAESAQDDSAQAPSESAEPDDKDVEMTDS
jgi:hypothetical protein